MDDFEKETNRDAEALRVKEKVLFVAMAAVAVFALIAIFNGKADVAPKPPDGVSFKQLVKEAVVEALREHEMEKQMGVAK